MKFIAGCTSSVFSFRRKRQFGYKPVKNFKKKEAVPNKDGLFFWKHQKSLSQ